MATTNPVITPEWTQIVAAGDEFTLAIPFTKARVNWPAFIKGAMVEIFTADDATPPAATLFGAPIKTGEGFNRQLSGPGVVFARSRGASVVVALTAWTE